MKANESKSNPNKQMGVYWLCEQATSTHEARVQLIGKLGYVVVFFNEIRSLVEYYNRKRVNIIVMEDDLHRENIHEALKAIVSHPNFYGVRIILNITKSGQNLASEIKTAYQESIRDIIPFDIDHKSWVTRFVYSTSSRSTDINLPGPFTEINVAAKAYVPGRVVWMGRQQLRLESRLDAAKGSQLNLVGPMAESLGLNALQLTVESREKKHLQYRFSESFVCNYSVPPQRIKQLHEFLDNLRPERDALGLGHGQGKIRVFIAVSNRDIRSQIFKSLQSQKYQLATALSKFQILEEPKYFTPHVVFLDASLVKHNDYGLITSLIANLQTATPIVILGERSDITDLKSLFPDRMFFLLNLLKGINLEEHLTKHFLPAIRALDGADTAGATRLRSSNPYSYCELLIPARIDEISPFGCRIRVESKIAKFGFVRLESNWFKNLGSEPILAKAVRDRPNRSATTKFGYLADILFLNVLQPRRMLIGQAMLQTLKQHLDEGQTPQVSQASRPIMTPIQTVQTLAEDDISIDHSTLSSAAIEIRPGSFKDSPIALPWSSRPKKVIRGSKKPQQGEQFLKLVVPLVMAIAFVAAVSFGVFWLAKLHGPAASSKAYSKQFEIIRDRMNSGK